MQLPSWIAPLLATCLLPAATFGLDNIHLLCQEMDFRMEVSKTHPETHCTVSGLQVSQGQTVVLPKGPRVHTVRFLAFYESRLIYMPMRLFDVFAGLRSVDMSHTEITVLTYGTFSGAGNLTTTNLSFNNLTELGTAAFMGAQNLIRLDLTGNRLATIKEDDFAGLDMLNKLYLAKNQLHSLERDAFKTNTYLDMLDLSNNLLEYVEPEVFSRLVHLREIDLSSNRLKRVDPLTFASANNLESVMVSWNYLDDFQLEQRIGTKLLIDHNNLTCLHINGGTKHVTANDNRIAQVVLHGAVLASYETLMLAHNNITDLVNITGMTSLLELDLSHNPLALLSTGAFDRLTRLRRLYLADTGLQRLTFGMFSRQTNVELLDLSYNNLTELNLDVFVPYLYNMHEFFVDGNGLAEVRGKNSWAQAFPNLRRLGVTLNRFNCTYLHALLTPPQLPETVVLHVEPDRRDDEESHIRDVSCVSEVRGALHVAERELHDMGALQQLLNGSLATMRMQEQRLEASLALARIILLLLVGIVCGMMGALGWQMWRRRQVPVSTYFVRRIGADSVMDGGSGTVFHSNSNTLGP